MHYVTNVTSTFSDELNLCEKKYPGIGKEIKKEFENLTFDEIFCKKYTLSDKGESKILKVRVGYGNSGKSSGFRVYLLLIKSEREMVFLYLHPKKGKRAKNSLKPVDLIEILKQYKEERSQKSLRTVHELNF